MSSTPQASGEAKVTRESLGLNDLLPVNVIGCDHPDMRANGWGGVWEYAFCPDCKAEYRAPRTPHNGGKLNGWIAALSTPSPTIAVTECTEHCSFRDREHTHYRNTVHAAPAPTIAAPSPSNEVTPEMVEASCEATYFADTPDEAAYRAIIEAALKARKPADDGAGQ